MKKRNILAIAVFAVISSFLISCGNSGQANSKDSSSDKETITIGYLPITHALAVFEEKEQLDNNPDSKIAIELKKFSSWPDLMDALNSGQIDGASVLVELAMGAVSQGIDLKAVALGHKDGNVIVVSNDIQSAKDLKGKNFAIPSNQSSHNILLNDMLKSAGIDISEVNVTQLSPAEMPSSLAGGSIDGYCVAEPFGAQSVVQGFGHVLYDSTELWKNSVCCALVFNGSYINNHATTVEKFVEGYYKAGDALDVETSSKIAKEYLGQDDSTLEVSLKWIHYDNLELTQEDYDVLSEKVKKYGINENPPSYEDFVYNSK